MPLSQRRLNFSLLAVCLVLIVALGISLKGQADLRAEVNRTKGQLAEMESVASATAGDAGVDIRDYIEPAEPMVLNGIATAVSQPPSGVDANDMGWKIWSVNRWVATTVSYVSDPRSGDYYAQAADTLLARAGDCDDPNILLASTSESVGLDAAIGYVDNVGDGYTDHLCVLVYYPGTAAEFRGTLTLVSPTDESTLRYVPTEGFAANAKYDYGIWMVADPSMSLSPHHVAYLTHLPYVILEVVDVGR